jgi:hypothetical protein
MAGCIGCVKRILRSGGIDCVLRNANGAQNAPFYDVRGLLLRMSIVIMGSF